MKILLVGRGWVGIKMYEELVKRGHTLIFSSHTSCFSFLESQDYDWVINCAGVTGVPNVDACESDRPTTMEGNANFPILLYHECRKRGIRFSHFSSGCIYSGVITDINAAPNFFGSIYSVSKGVSDYYLKDKAQVYRIRMPFTKVEEPKNYITKIINYSKYGKLIESGPNSLSDLDEAIVVACNLIERNAPNGPYNLVNSGVITMHEFVDIFKLTPKWFTPHEFKLATVAERSTCSIPPYEEMTNIHDALNRALVLLDNSK
jgi:dTDP-4-dehydrorhamnose reductase